MAPVTSRVAAQPIGWSNDDFRDLGGETPLEQCLAEMREAGYSGTELGHKFPREPKALIDLLGRYGLALASGWHSTYLLSKPYAWEEASLRAHLALLKAAGSRVAIVAECTSAIYAKPGLSLRGAEDNGLLPEAWDTLVTSLERLASVAEGEGLALAYHPHMGTVIQNEGEVERLLAGTKRLGLVLDTGHLAFAGADPSACARRWKTRVAHVHFKNVRPEIVARARAAPATFERAVRDGVFTVPGDGGLDFAPILATLRGAGYRGWFVVEAEQDPTRANPLQYFTRARAYLKELGV